MYVYDALNNFKLVTRLYSAKESVVSLDVTLDGRYVVSMGPVAEVTVWDTTTFLSLEDADKQKMELSPISGDAIAAMLRKLEAGLTPDLLARYTAMAARTKSGAKQ